jgi:hypothetical protein
VICGDHESNPEGLILSGAVTDHPTRSRILPGVRQLAKLSEFLGEGFQIHAPDRRTEKDMQAGGIRDATDFLAKPIGNPIKADFQSLDNVLLTGENLSFLPTLLPAFLP